MHTAHSQEVRTSGRLVLRDPVAGKRTILDLAQHVLHLLAGLFGDQALAGDVIPVFSRIRDRVTHHREAAAVDQIDDQLHLMDAFEICHFRRVSGFDQRIEASLHQFADTAAQHGLLTEQVGLGLFLEGRLDDACAAGADAACVSQRILTRFAGSVLMDSDQR